MSGQVTLYLDRVEAVIKGATEEGLAALALVIEGKTKANIAANDQVDTGFMLNSVYAMSRKSSNFGAAQSAALGSVYSRKTGRTVAPRAMGEQPSFPDDETLAGVVVGAEYAIFQELRRPFLNPAAEEVVGQAGGVLEPIYRSMVND